MTTTPRSSARRDHRDGADIAQALLDAVQSGRARDLRSAARAVGVGVGVALARLNADEQLVEAWREAVCATTRRRQTRVGDGGKAAWRTYNRLVDAAERGAASLLAAAKAARVDPNRARRVLAVVAAEDPAAQRLWERALAAAKGRQGAGGHTPATVTLRAGDLPDVIWIPGDPGYPARAAAARAARAAPEWRREDRGRQRADARRDEDADARLVAVAAAGGGMLADNGHRRRGPEGGRQSARAHQAWLAVNHDLEPEEEDA